jgi:hypothetical protein
MRNTASITSAIKAKSSENVRIAPSISCRLASPAIRNRVDHSG